ncbi:MAG: type VI secretion system tip protein TssI/VgrG [Polyangiaceae bacterium]
MTKAALQVRLESESFSTDSVEVSRLSGKERISSLFRFDVDIVATAATAPSRDEMVGALATLVFERGDQELRRIHGMIARVDEAIETEAETRRFRLQIVPRAFRLSMVETQEVFMDMSVPDILRQLAGQVELDDGVTVDVLGEPRKLEFVVQYKESNLNFASRLTEHHGISFFFRQEETGDQLVFSDGRFPPLEARPSIPLRLTGDKTEIYELSVETKVIPLTYAVMDYNYRSPLLDLTASEDAPNGFAGGVAEYGTHLKTPTDATAFAKIRAEERESQREVYTGKSDVPALSAGFNVHIEGGKSDDLDLLIVEVEHEATLSTRTHGGSETAHYHNTFRAISSALTYRPPRVTPRPRIFGIVTGIIEQPDGVSTRYARIDKHGRYRVRFLFDTAAPGERKASHPVRMAQPSAGAGTGMHFPLRPGTEVVLAFIDGDPDRPIIVAAVPNATTPSPVTATNSLKNQIRTASGVILEIKDS